CLFFLLRIGARPKSVLFPYSTLFRSLSARDTLSKPASGVVAHLRYRAVGVHHGNGPSSAVVAQVLGAVTHGVYDRLEVPSPPRTDRKSTRLNSSHVKISYAVFCLKKK